MSPSKSDSSTVVKSLESERATCFKIQDTVQKSVRVHIRETMGGTSKMITHRLQQTVHSREEITSFPMDSKQRHQELLEDLRELTKSGVWPVKYWDSHESWAIIKVDSHQIDD